MNFNYYSISIKGFFSKKYLIDKNKKPYLTVEKPSFFSSEHIFYDSNGDEVLAIRKPFSLFTYKYELFAGSNFIGHVVKENFSNAYKVDTIDDFYSAKLNFTGTEYTFYDGEMEIAKGTRKIFSSENAYQVAIMEGYQDHYILATLVISSLVRRSKRRKKG